MEKEGLSCDCKDWKENAGIINSALSLYDNHGFGGIKKSGSYCLWCGKKLRQENKNE